MRVATTSGPSFAVVEGDQVHLMAGRRCAVNGEAGQDGSTSDLLFPLQELLASHISRWSMQTSRSPARGDEFEGEGVSVPVDCMAAHLRGTMYKP